MAKKTQIQAMRARSRQKATEAKFKDQLKRVKNKTAEMVSVQKMSTAAGLGVGGLLTGSVVGEINRLDPGGKVNPDTGEYERGYGRAVSYVAGAAGAIACGLVDGPIGNGVAVTAGTMIAAQRAIDVFTGEGLTKGSKGVTVTVTRPPKE